LVGGLGVVANELGTELRGVAVGALIGNAGDESEFQSALGAVVLTFEELIGTLFDVPKFAERFGHWEGCSTLPVPETPACEKPRLG
jgi:hypothetical protein